MFILRWWCVIIFERNRRIRFESCFVRLFEWFDDCRYRYLYTYILRDGHARFSKYRSARQETKTAKTTTTAATEPSRRVVSKRTLTAENWKGRYRRHCSTDSSTRRATTTGWRTWRNFQRPTRVFLLIINAQFSHKSHCPSAVLSARV